MLKTNQTLFRVKKVIKGKIDKVYVKWKGCDNLTVGLVKKIMLYKMTYSLAPNIHSKTKKNNWIRFV